MVLVEFKVFEMGFIILLLIKYFKIFVEKGKIRGSDYRLNFSNISFLIWGYKDWFYVFLERVYCKDNFF